ncbi:MAG TPA: ABC transporter permease [Thermoanaerobacterales bacterium]|nr:ABC transporter permease [Thermoanaerobacterales bacterium]
MKTFLLKKLMQIIPVLFIISFIVFLLVYVAGDPVLLMLPDDATPEDIEALRSALGLDKPFITQYCIYLTNMLKGDFGRSFRYNQPALPIVLERLPASLQLTFSAIIFSIVVSIPLGIWSATKQNTFLDVFISGISVLGRAMPHFWVGIMLVLILSVNFKILPVSGRGTAAHLILPTFTLGISVASELTRLVRSNMLEILQQDYIRTAKSKGLSDFIIIFKHAFKNALIPVVTFISIQIPMIIGGALITETVFSWPGLGQLIVQAVYGRDMAIIQACVFVIAILAIAISLVTDFIYSMIDKRIQYS